MTRFHTCIMTNKMVNLAQAHNFATCLLKAMNKCIAWENTRYQSSTRAELFDCIAQFLQQRAESTSCQDDADNIKFELAQVAAFSHKDSSVCSVRRFEAEVAAPLRKWIKDVKALQENEESCAYLQLRCSH